MRQVRIIGGVFGGRRLQTPPGNKTHPMSERARGALFNKLHQTVQNADVLDVFAGTGAIGLEAISRGAEHVTFIEKDRAAQQTLADNISRLGVEAQSKAACMSANTWMKSHEPSAMFDIIFADPPYQHTQLSTVWRLVDYLKVGGTMVLSLPGRGEVPSEVKRIVVVDNRSYGNAYLTFFRREE